jgi:tetratricopeptide (TPR) repeat protein
MALAPNTNPFVVGGAINSADGRGFYGRDDIFTFVSSALNSVQRAPILLIGQRRIGKSSVLKQLQLRLGTFYKCVFYDLQGRAELTLDETLYGLGRAIADGLSIPRPSPADCTDETFPAFLKSACEALQGHPERLILLFDEFDVVDQTFAGRDIAAKRFIPYLADIVGQFPALGYILVVGRRTEELSDGFFSSLLRQTVQMRLGRLNKEQTAKLISDSFGRRFSALAINEVFQITAGHPFCAQILCSTLWNRFPAPEVIGAKQVADAVDTAIKQWTNGLNWNYDSFEESSQRLFLSALGSLSGKNALDIVPMEDIQRTLSNHRVGIEQSKLHLAPQELLNWDVIKARNQGPKKIRGYQFTVPLIGAWIQMTRPLQDFEQETRLINPRAAKYYDLALENLERENLGAAIGDFRNALEANPVFIEAQLGLASALRTRKGSKDLDDAVEAYERVLELDPSTAPTALLDILVDNIEGSSADSAKALRRYRRIKDLEPSGLHLERGRRLLDAMAEVRFNYGMKERLEEALDIWEATGNSEGVGRAEERLARIERVRTIYAYFAIFFAVLWVLAALVKLIGGWEYSIWVPLWAAALGSLAVSCRAAARFNGELSFLQMGWAALAAGMGVGALLRGHSYNPFTAGSIFLVVYVVNWFTYYERDDLPAELKP